MISAADIPGITHGFFTRAGGHSTGLYASLNTGLGSGDDKSVVTMNREIVRARMGAQHLITAWQVHSAVALAVTAPWEGAPPEADGLATSVPGLALGVLTADCGPILFADAEARVIGAAHAGWGGAFKGIAEATLDQMETLGARRGRITALLGPMISQGNYETGPEFIARFAEKEFFAPSSNAGHFMFDLPGYIAMRLRRAGVGTVIDTALCTYEDAQRFFSYRRATHRGEPVYGRQISAIMIKEH